MLEMSDSVEPVHPAATVVLVRDGSEGLEVLLVQRNKAVQHMGGMWVFPGGKVDPADYPSNGDTYIAARNAAIRETREEAGLRSRLNSWFTSRTGLHPKAPKNASPPGFSLPS